MRDPLPERLPDDELEEIKRLLAEPGGFEDELSEMPAAEPEVMREPEVTVLPEALF